MFLTCITVGIRVLIMAKQLVSANVAGALKFAMTRPAAGFNSLPQTKLTDEHIAALNPTSETHCRQAARLR